MMPSLFIAHGAPLLAIENNEYTQFINQIGKNCQNQKPLCYSQPIGRLLIKR